MSITANQYNKDKFSCIEIINMYFYFLRNRVLNLRVFSFIRDSYIDKKAVVSRWCRVYRCSIDKYSYIGKKSEICNTKIGAFCSIAPYSIIGAGSHPISNISTSPVFYSTKNILNKSFFVDDTVEEYDDVVIGNDVWIGTHSFIKGGVTLGNGAIIGAYSVVTKDVEPYCIVAGNPARIIRKRFTDEIIIKMQELKFWELPDHKLAELAKYANDVEVFLEKASKK